MAEEKDSIVRVFFTAVQFLTRIPVPGGNRPVSPETLRLSVAFFPLAGALIGCVTAGIIYLGTLLWPAWLAILAGLACEARITGAFHEDAVADFFDAFGGGWTREDVLKILKDSRLGSFGAVALFLALAIRAGALTAIEPPLRYAVLIASTTLGRWAILLLMMLLSPVQNRESLTKDVGKQATPGLVLFGTLAALPGMTWWLYQAPLRATVAIGFIICLAIYFRMLLRRRIGGTTGDCLGTVCYLGQLIVLLTGAARI